MISKNMSERNKVEPLEACQLVFSFVVGRAKNPFWK